MVESLRSLASASLANGGFLRTWRFTRFSTDAVAFLLAPAVVAAAFALGWRRRDALLLFSAGAAAGSAAILLLAHALLAVPFPVDRIGIYFLTLMPLALAALADSGIAPGRFQQVFAPALYGLGLALVVVFAAEFNIRRFLVWNTTRTPARLQTAGPRLAAAGNLNPLEWELPGQLEPSLNFYRDKDRLSWMLPVARGSLVPGADFYVLMAADRSVIGTLGLKPVGEWPQSGSVLAVPAAPR